MAMPVNVTGDLHVLSHGWIDSPDTRGTFDIIWTCFFTIFVCTFTVLHLNVPSPDEKYGQILLRKVKWMVFAIVIPELVTASAFVQRVAAVNSVKEMKDLEEKKKSKNKKDSTASTTIESSAWTIHHAFYWNMGGVWLKPKDDERGFPIDAALQTILVREGVMQLPQISKAEIWDRSKADKFAKLLACVQIAWLTIQCISRAIQGLPISLLEIGTVGFALPSFVTFALWFSKPNDIETVTTIEVDLTADEIVDRLAVLKGKDSSIRDTPLDCIKAINRPSATSEVVLKASWWPLRHRFESPANRIRNDIFGLKYTILDQVFVSSVWIGYAAVHLSAWNFTFPSRTEQIMWRVSTIAMSASIVLGWLVGNRKFYLIFSCLSSKMKTRCRRVSDERAKVSIVQLLFGAAAGLIYLVARMCIIVEALISLRALPVGVLKDVDWTRFLPHV